MQPHDVFLCLGKLRDLFPSMNEEQSEVIEKEFARHPVDLVQRAISEHYETHSFVVGADLIGWLRRNGEERTTPAQRHAAEVSAYEARKAQRAADAKAVEMDNARAATIVGRLPACERERLKAEILAKLPFLASKLADCDVMASPTLIALVAGQLVKKGVAA